MHSLVLPPTAEMIFPKASWCITPGEGIWRRTQLYPVQHLLRRPFGSLLSVSLKYSGLLCRDLEKSFAYLLVLFSLFQTYSHSLKFRAILWMSPVTYILTSPSLRGFSKNSSFRYYELPGKVNSLCVVAKFKEANIKIWIDKQTDKQIHMSTHI